MAQELTYALITPYSLSKSRTGGIISRLLTLAENLELIGARMYAPGDAFVDRYIATIREMDMQPALKAAFVDYLSENLRSTTTNPAGNRCPVLFLRGENAIELLKDNAVGSAVQDPTGDTVRGAYGDFILDADGRIRHFEPAVLVATDARTNARHLRLFAEFARTDGGVLEHVVRYPQGTKVETTLVILKPDNFTRQSTRPGNIIDMFSRTGLRIIAAKVLRMSVAQGEEFYGPLVDVFRTRLRPGVTAALREALSGVFDFDIDDDTYVKMTDMLADKNALCEFHKIVEYMTGVDPASVRTPAERKKPGEVRCLALLYQGEDAVAKIRERLGATDPDKAAAATVRSGFGQDLMKNAAHASDSIENAERERRIVGLLDNDEPEIVGVVERYLQSAGG
ncbi:MAG TPA: nucleoside-diphosphate kinase [Planctomycetota bacterium]|nr:nucleoside-diphosphate kinase [Planctomycetota bacterium]